MESLDISLEIKNFRAIKEANLKLNGLTVVSGINSSGKSTIAKTLYYIIRIGLNYDFILENLLRSRVGYSLANYAVYINDLVRSMVASHLIEEDYFRGGVLALNDSVSVEEQVDSIKVYLDSIILLESKIRENSNENLKKLLWRANYVLLPSFLKNHEGALQKEFNDAFINELQRWIKETADRKRFRNIDSFCELCKNVFKIEIPSDISFKEGGIEIFEKRENRVRPLRELNKTFYIDTPWIVDFLEPHQRPNATIHAHWKDLILEIKNKEDAVDDIVISKNISSTIRGRALGKKDLYTESRFFYERNDSKSFLLKESATGIKSLGIIQLLAERNAFDDKTLLILDEPESHLHPQWIVEYARILVLMQKQFGVKILVASHSPDMIDALQTFSKSAGISDRTNFYLAEESKEDSFSYTYKSLENSIAKIYQAFNIAAARIADYEKRIDEDIVKN